MWPADAVAAVWKRTSRSLVVRPISPIGSIVPISALACITETSTVSGRMARRTSSGSTFPSLSAERVVTSYPRFRRGGGALNTEKGSTSATTTGSPFFARAAAAPFIARLFASVEPEVKTISCGLALTKRATSARAASPACTARCPWSWMGDDGVGYHSVRYGIIASSTRGSRGVVEIWSQKMCANGNPRLLLHLELGHLVPDELDVSLLFLRQELEHRPDRRIPH